MSQRSVAQLVKHQVIHLSSSASVREAAQLMSGESDRFFTQSIFS